MSATLEPGQPQGLVGGGIGGYRPLAAPIQQRVVASGPANLLPLLSVSHLNMCTLTKSLLLATNLSGGRHVHLVVPAIRGGDWYLDTNPKPGVGNRLPEQGRALFRVPPIKREHFMRPTPTIARSADGRGNVTTANHNAPQALLHFRLGEQVAGHPGYYHLHRVGAVNH